MGEVPDPAGTFVVSSGCRAIESGPSHPEPDAGLHIESDGVVPGYYAETDSPEDVIDLVEEGSRGGVEHGKGAAVVQVHWHAVDSHVAHANEAEVSETQFAAVATPASESDEGEASRLFLAGNKPRAEVYTVEEGGVILRGRLRNTRQCLRHQARIRRIGPTANADIDGAAALVTLRDGYSSRGQGGTVPEGGEPDVASLLKVAARGGRHVLREARSRTGREGVSPIPQHVEGIDRSVQVPGRVVKRRRGTASRVLLGGRLGALIILGRRDNRGCHETENTGQGGSAQAPARWRDSWWRGARRVRLPHGGHVAAGDIEGAKERCELSLWARGVMLTASTKRREGIGNYVPE